MIRPIDYEQDGTTMRICPYCTFHGPLSDFQIHAKHQSHCLFALTPEMLAEEQYGESPLKRAFAWFRRKGGHVSRR